MKNLCVVFLFISLGMLQVKAQFPGGFFSQQSNQRKLMAEQIAAYEVYRGVVKSGYQIVQKGLNTANSLKEGTFGLHKAYFNSLEQVNPLSAANPKGIAINAMARQASTLLNSEITWQQKQHSLRPNELQQLRNIALNLQKEMGADITELGQVLTPGKLQLTDKQRLERLDHLNASMKDKLAFAGAYTAKCRRLANARQQELRDKEQIKKLYGIH